jgi:chromate reductase, NAD(P)H dehydrogenase (quinone)
LLESLRVIEAKDIDHLHLLISFAATKVSLDNKITDEKTLGEVKGLIFNFERSIRDSSLELE